VPGTWRRKRLLPIGPSCNRRCTNTFQRPYKFQRALAHVKADVLELIRVFYNPDTYSRSLRPPIYSYRRISVVPMSHRINLKTNKRRTSTSINRRNPPLKRGFKAPMYDLAWVEWRIFEWIHPASDHPRSNRRTSAQLSVTTDITALFTRWMVTVMGRWGLCISVRDLTRHENSRSPSRWEREKYSGRRRFQRRWRCEWQSRRRGWKTLSLGRNYAAVLRCLQADGKMAASWNLLLVLNSKPVQE